MIKSFPPLALIAGPTASGKSALALELARLRNGVIINADSAQLYRDLPILSAAPSLEERASVDHRLYGVRDGADPCSAAGWAALARAEIASVHAEGRLPILVGGTGLYIRTLLDGIAPVPKIDPAIRDTIRNRSVADNRAELVRLDPEAAARLNPADTTRIARALEVVRSSGHPLSHWQQQREGGIVDTIDLKPLILLPPRPWLYQRCDQRFAAMIDQGAVDEVRRLLARSLDPNLPVMRAIGVAEIASGSVNIVTLGQQSTRRYAKRQYTWFANQPPADWPRHFAPYDARSANHALALLGAER
ncbi:tRNA (adenosine(37)-N6)-dimethylallyltransferase MiaA [Sphingomonas sp.]|uniref:tRNA (adenosine(37)-N6)-dimethylallyltransferase MiaA n=1 Tax=Sphingomonas sp. TaxID=28214 RepID=UPI00286ABFA9|nr:tRNA (adenosine(37)-N6)-dimethylallyltransferase MiaA [Sphingomonas sp.]